MGNNENILLDLLERILGESNSTSHDNHAFNCPNNCHPYKKKLEVNLKTQKYNCWVCGGNKNGFRGKGVFWLFRKLDINKKYFNELKSITPKYFNYKSEENIREEVSLPKEIKYFDNLNEYNITGKKALKYLYNRGLTHIDIIRYKIGYCDSGKYAGYLILPFYDNIGELSYFTARSFQPNPFLKYKNPPISRNIIPNELDINWWLPIILCEGAFDYYTIKRNCIPLLGKDFQPIIYERIIQKSKNPNFYIILDPDAKNNALEFCKQLMDEGLKPHLVDLYNKDPNELGDKIFKIIDKSQPLDFEMLLKYKIK